MLDDYHTVLRLINSHVSLPLVYAGCHEVLRSRMPAPNLYVCILEAEGLRFPYYEDEQLPENPLEIYPKEGLTGYVIDTGQRFWWSKDRQPPEEATPVGPIPQDWVGVPLINRDGSVLGVLAIQTYQSGTFYSEADVAFIEFVADALSVAIQLARQDREIAIRRIAALVEETIEITDLYPKIHEVMQLIIPAARKNIYIARVDEASGMFLPVYWRDERDSYDTMEWPLHLGFSGYIYSITQKSFIYEDGRSTMPPEVIPIGSPSTYWLGAPLFSQDRIIGIVVIQSYNSTDIITKEDQYALNGICPYIASTISRTELFSRLQRP
ncbi:MAG: GAF domain-containing protein [Spirochaetales bacterium]|nr:MAG: GAF domain-containing protein [Spirochaetales bacterium]